MSLDLKNTSDMTPHISRLEVFFVTQMSFRLGRSFTVLMSDLDEGELADAGAAPDVSDGDLPVVLDPAPAAQDVVNAGGDLVPLVVVAETGGGDEKRRLKPAVGIGCCDGGRWRRALASAERDLVNFSRSAAKDKQRIDKEVKHRI